MIGDSIKHNPLVFADAPEVSNMPNPYVVLYALPLELPNIVCLPPAAKYTHPSNVNAAGIVMSPATICNDAVLPPPSTATDPAPNFLIDVLTAAVQIGVNVYVPFLSTSDPLSALIKKLTLLQYVSEYVDRYGSAIGAAGGVNAAV